MPRSLTPAERLAAAGKDTSLDDSETPMVPHQRTRGDTVEEWLKQQRDRHFDRYGRNREWYALDDLLDAYRLHADTCTPLGEHACEAQAVGACDCLETAQ
ncbi:hypothetical protein JK364_24200 [Streptomyces sp. 110]|uniref:Uncharacterized protein n=1 Tax=Streptomyces endocoffeicus TaxID=2898945 RepID=A0ABS1PSR7_9ACTN|nr:hypothetical protein [Streptomyces endocoffeicus]MBL1115476.1 hypothetical protein [Streptomyces endocoffeicus]